MWEKICVKIRLAISGYSYSAEHPELVFNYYPEELLDYNSKWLAYNKEEWLLDNRYFSPLMEFRQMYFMGKYKELAAIAYPKKMIDCYPRYMAKHFPEVFFEKMPNELIIRNPGWVKEKYPEYYEEQMFFAERKITIM